MSRSTSRNFVFYVILGWVCQFSLGFQSVNVYPTGFRGTSHLTPMVTNKLQNIHTTPTLSLFRSSVEWNSASTAKSRAAPSVFKRLKISILSALRTLKKKSMSAVLAAFILVAFAPAAFATTAGRMGGSFDQSSRMSNTGTGATRAPVSRPVPGARIYRASEPNTVMYSQPRTRVYATKEATTEAPAARKITTSDMVLLATTGSLIAYGFSNNRREGESPLGPGATFASLTMTLDVPDRDDPDCILLKLRRLADKTDLTTRKSVQNLLTEVSLELQRQVNTAVSASTTVKHYKDVAQAQREFQRQSVQDRSKFDKETVNKFGKENEAVRSSTSRNAVGMPKSTTAVVTLNLAIEGDKTNLPTIRSRPDLLNALTRISTDSQVDACLLSAEILWAPEERTDELSHTDIYAMFPTLATL